MIAGIGLEAAQRRVVPRELVDRRQLLAFSSGAACRREEHVALVEGDEVDERRHRGGRRHQQHDRLLAVLDVGPMAVELVVGDGRRDRRDLLAEQPILPRELLGEGAGVDDRVEADHDVDPVVVRRVSGISASTMMPLVP